jgi:hypothetical protein
MAGSYSYTCGYVLITGANAGLGLDIRTAARHVEAIQRGKLTGRAFLDGYPGT